MATTSWWRAFTMQLGCRNTFIALQDLVMAMADYSASRDAYQRIKFERTLSITLGAILLDKDIAIGASADEFRIHLLARLTQFGKAFPNWQDAQQFADEYFAANKVVANTLIQDLLERQKQG